MRTRLLPRGRGPRDLGLVEEISRVCAVSQTVAQILVARGIGDADAAERFLHPAKKDFYDPFLLAGMKDAVARIRQAIEESETVVVYGDYDCDGIAATAILTRCLTSHGVTVCPYIPSRKTDGYGIMVDALECLIEEALPDLIITCDCGISAHDEIAAVADSGIDFIVTDHHEISKALPECIVVNPKLPGQAYPYSELCGAAVAWKLVHAVFGIEEALRYIDLAALATVADFVPLVDENRTIVALGLEKINSGRGVNPGIVSLIKDLGTVSAGDIAYKVAPRVNAAGRMGDANRAFRLFVSDAQDEIRELTAEIDRENLRRKEMSGRMYEEAKQLVRTVDLADSFCLVLSHPTWEKGITSIVAAQIAGDYYRPTFLIVGSGEELKGTARSIEGINIFETLSACKDLLIGFGGHAQAAGFEIKRAHIPAFRKAVNQTLKEHFAPSVFEPKCYFDAELGEEHLQLSLSRELSVLEPFGNGNPRPALKTPISAVKPEPMRAKPYHLILKTAQLSINAFGFGPCYSIFKTPSEFQVVTELSTSRFGGRDSLSCTLKDFDFDRLVIDRETARLCAGSELFGLAYVDKPFDTQIISIEDVKNLLKRKPLGTLLVCYRPETYQKALEDLNEFELRSSLFVRESTANFHRIVLAPMPDFDTIGVENIVLLDGGMDERLLPFLVKDEVNVYATGRGDPSVIADLSAERQVFVRVFSAFRGATAGKNLAEALSACAIACGMEYRQTVACYAVFYSLGFVRWDYGLLVDSGVRRGLSESAGYRMLGGACDHH